MKYLIYVIAIFELFSFSASAAPTITKFVVNGNTSISVQIGTPITFEWEAANYDELGITSSVEGALQGINLKMNSYVYTVTRVGEITYTLKVTELSSKPITIEKSVTVTVMGIEMVDNLAAIIKVMRLLVDMPTTSLFADINQDGKVGIEEAIWGLQYVAGLIEP